MAGEVRTIPGPHDGSGFGGTLSSARTVLVVAPTRAKAGELAGALQDRGIPAPFATAGRQAAYWLREEPPALIAIDMKTSGARLFMEHVRQEGRSVLAISNDASERTRALEAGCTAADPDLSPEEIALKVAALLRDDRLRRTGQLAAGDLVVDLSARALVWQGDLLPTPPLLLDLAACLAARAGTFVSVAALLEEVWGEAWAPPDKAHKAVWRLRNRLGLPHGSGFIVGKWGHGYGMFPEAAIISSSRRTMSK
jgi:DNA-binding response OmpR family regulator